MLNDLLMPLIMTSVEFTAGGVTAAHQPRRKYSREKKKKRKKTPQSGVNLK